MDEREMARAEISDSRERMKDIASQLARRANPDYVKERAKAAAMQKGVEVKNRIAGSPLALGILGGLATAGIARMLFARRARLAQPSYEPGARYTGYSGYTGYAEHSDSAEADVAGNGKVDRIKDKAGELKERAMEGLDHLRERIPSGEEMKLKAQEIGGRATEYAGDRPLATAAGALVVGAALGCSCR
jgi:ElaB/YqjD/DUF883 family membrane-anchored ribosome-binding protein